MVKHTKQARAVFIAGGGNVSDFRGGHSEKEIELKEGKKRIGSVGVVGWLVK